jgi:hypothetical protein
MVFDIQHKIRYRIKFIKPVDLFDVIYKLKIQTRNDFKGCENYIDLIEIDPINDVFFETFMLKHRSLWFNYNNQTVYSRFKNKEDIVSHLIDRYFLDDDTNELRTVPTELINKMAECLVDYQNCVNNIVFNESTQKTLDHILSDEAIKSNIQSIGFEDYWQIV